MKCAKGVLPAAAVLFFITVLTHFPVSAETYFASEDYKYTYRYDGTIAVAGYMGTSSVLDIPSQISDRDVTEISAKISVPSTATADTSSRLIR